MAPWAQPENKLTNSLPTNGASCFGNSKSRSFNLTSNRLFGFASNKDSRPTIYEPGPVRELGLEVKLDAAGRR